MPIAILCAPGNSGNVFPTWTDIGFGLDWIGDRPSSSRELGGGAKGHGGLDGAARGAGCRAYLGRELFFGTLFCVNANDAVPSK